MPRIRRADDQRVLERLAIAAVAAGITLAIAAATGYGRTSSGGFTDVPRGKAARFLGTTTICVNPKGQIPGGQVACKINYRAPRTITQLVPTKFDVGLTLRCVDLSKWSRKPSRMLRSGRFC